MFAFDVKKAALVQRAAGADPRSALGIARHLVRLRNFSSASRILLDMDWDLLPLVDQAFVGVTLLNGKDGLAADQLLLRRLAGIEIDALSPPEIARLAEWVQLSGIAAPRKLQLIGDLRDRAIRIPSAVQTVRDLRFREFRLRTSALERVDVLDAMRPEGSDPYCRKDDLRYVADLVTSGNSEIAHALVRRQLAQHGLGDRAVLEAALRLDSGALIEDLEAVPVSLRGTPGVLALAYDARGTSDAHRAFFDACLGESTRRFASMDVYAQDSLLRVLTVKDLLPPLAELVPSLHGVPDAVLGARCGRGLIAMEDGANRDAADLLESVLAEDPAYTAAATGLRFVYARLDGDETVIALRNRIGYGAASAGRVGVRLGDRDQATSLLLRGEYLKSWSVRRTAPHWQRLKIELGPKFLNYEPLPNDPGSSLFLIADDGVGDEIRSAQYLGELAKRSAVTATCDPRLLPLLRRSFPAIDFVGVPRRVRGILNPVYDGRYSDPMLASHVPAVCDALIARADHVTFGQNLTFNRFAGLLPREDTGAYLVPDPARAVVPQSAERLRVGLVWKSHFSSGSRRMMYLDVAQFQPLLDVAGVEFWSVQHAASDAESAYCAEHGIRQIQDVDLFDDFEGLAAHLASMDLIIGISTVPMELAVAVGTPAWLLGFSPENFYYRTRGGRTSVDQLSRNSTVIAPRWIDFTAPYQDCVDLAMADCRERLVRLVRETGRG